MPRRSATFALFSVLASLLQVEYTIRVPAAEPADEDFWLWDDVTSLLQAKPARINNKPMPIFPIDKIRARGSPVYVLPDLTPDEYILSRPAVSLGITETNAKLGGGTEEYPIFPDGQVPGELPGDTGEEGIQVNDPGDVCSAGDISGYSVLNVSSPSLVSFVLPRDSPGRRAAAVIVAPGGGRRFLSWTKEGTEIAQWLNSIGISAFVLKYRVPSNTAETVMKPVMDAQRAISIVRGLGAKHDFKAVGFMGFSAGGYIAAGLNAMRDRTYSPIDETDDHSFMPDFSLLLYAASRADIRPVDNPPSTFIGIARDDPCVSASSAAAYYAALNAAGGSHELHIFASGKHGYGDCSLYVNGGSWKPVCAWTLNAQLFIENLLKIKRPLEAMTYPTVTSANGG